MSDRQAGAANAVDLGDKTESAALTFRSHQDALDYARHVVEDSNRRATCLNPSKLVESYCDGWIYCYVGAFSRICGEQYEFFFYRVPCGNTCGAEIREVSVFPLSPECDAANAHWRKGAMLFGVTELIYGPEGVIPSFVWVETPKKVNDFRRQVSADFPLPVNSTVKLDKIIREGEISFLQGCRAAGYGGSVPTLIQSSTEIVDCIKHDASKPIRDSLGESELMDFLSRVKIKIDNGFPWLFADKSINEAFKITDVMMRPVKRKPWAMEQITHEREGRSHERSGISESDKAFSEHSATST